jgi:hypothetical protein
MKKEKHRQPGQGVEKAGEKRDPQQRGPGLGNYRMQPALVIEALG